jgi:hypothetical protein
MKTNSGVRGEMARKVGAPPKGEYVDRKSTLTTRITSELRGALDTAAAQSGRSLGQEVERRLRRSFDEEQRIIETLGGRENYAILRLISCVLDSHGGDWRVDEANFDYIVAATALVLRLFGPRETRPEIIPLLPDGTPDDARLGAFIAGRVVAAHVVDSDEKLPPGATDEPRDPGPYIKADLLPHALKRLEQFAAAKPIFVPHAPAQTDTDEGDEK